MEGSHAYSFLGRKRALKQTITRQQKLERRLKREEREAARKQYSFMERINIRRMKNLWVFGFYGVRVTILGHCVPSAFV